MLEQGRLINLPPSGGEDLCFKRARRLIMRNTEMYDLESVLTDGRLTADPSGNKADNEPFKAYQALNMVRALGRPLTDEEMKSLTIRKDDSPRHRNVAFSGALAEA